VRESEKERINQLKNKLAFDDVCYTYSANFDEIINGDMSIQSCYSNCFYDDSFDHHKLFKYYYLLHFSESIYRCILKNSPNKKREASSVICVYFKSFFLEDVNKLPGKQFLIKAIYELTEVDRMSAKYLYYQFLIDFLIFINKSDDGVYRSKIICEFEKEISQINLALWLHLYQKNYCFCIFRKFANNREYSINKKEQATSPSKDCRRISDNVKSLKNSFEDINWLRDFLIKLRKYINKSTVKSSRLECKEIDKKICIEYSSILEQINYGIENKNQIDSDMMENYITLLSGEKFDGCRPTLEKQKENLDILIEWTYEVENNVKRIENIKSMIISLQRMHKNSELLYNRKIAEQSYEIYIILRSLYQSFHKCTFSSITQNCCYDLLNISFGNVTSLELIKSKTREYRVLKSFNRLTEIIERVLIKNIYLKALLKNAIMVDGGVLINEDNIKDIIDVFNSIQNFIKNNISKISKENFRCLKNPHNIKQKYSFENKLNKDLVKYLSYEKNRDAVAEIIIN